MGLNIAGLVIDKNYQNELTTLGEILNRTLVFEKEVPFEEAIESWKEDDYCDVFYTKMGTFVLLSGEVGINDHYAANQTAFSFVISESTMLFSVNYTKNDQLIRCILDSEEMSEDEGTPFEFEKEDNSTENLIYHLIEQTLGKSFDEIELDATCYRYIFADNEDTDNDYEMSYNVVNESSIEEKTEHSLNEALPFSHQEQNDVNKAPSATENNSWWSFKRLLQIIKLIKNGM